MMRHVALVGYNDGCITEAGASTRPHPPHELTMNLDASGGVATWWAIPGPEFRSFLSYFSFVGFLIFLQVVLIFYSLFLFVFSYSFP